MIRSDTQCYTIYLLEISQYSYIKMYRIQLYVLFATPLIHKSYNILYNGSFIQLYNIRFIWTKMNKMRPKMDKKRSFLAAKCSFLAASPKMSNSLFQIFCSHFFHRISGVAASPSDLTFCKIL